MFSQRGLREHLRFEWFTKVETEADLDSRLSEAKCLLVEGPAAYNELVTKYVM
jgi:hypothetical protein